MPLDYPIATHTLANGLRVVVSQDTAVPVVALSLWVDVGSRHEQPGRSGLAHLFEHLMFEGSANVAEGEHFEALMAQGGRVNATTWFDRTTYFETVPRGALELALWLEADRHGRLLPAVTQAALDTQRDVVKEEKRQRYDNQPYGTALLRTGELVFPPGHPYHHPTIGSMADLDAASLDDVHAFYRTHYGPDTTVLTMAGDIDPDEGFALADRYFGGLRPTDRPAARPGPSLEPLTEPVLESVPGEVPNDRLYLGFRLPVAHTEEFTACALALDALGGLAISRLYRTLVRRREVASWVSTSALGLVDGASLGLVVVDVEDGVDPELVEDLVCAELDRFGEQGPSPVELEASLADTERAWLEALAGLEERADLISHFTLLHDDPHHINGYLDAVARVSADTVRDAAARWLAPGARSSLTFRSEGRGAGSPPEVTGPDLPRPEAAS